MPPDAGIVLQTDIVRGDLGSYNNPDMFVCEVQDFLASYGPCLNITDNDDVDPFYQKMKEEAKLRLCDDGTYRWFESGVADALAFKHLERIIDYVLENVKDKVLKEMDMQFISLPYKKLASDIPGDDHKIDGCFIAEPSTSRYNLSKLPNKKIYIPGKLKKKRSGNDRAIVRH